MAEDKPIPASFADYPMTLGEHRTDDNAANWTPREALISTLRALDRGEIKPDAIVVCYRTPVEDEKGVYRSGFRSAAPDVHVTLGLLQWVSARIIGGGK